MEAFKYADQTEVQASMLMTQEYANFLGSVHGGYVLRQVDNHAYVCAARYAGNPTCVTAAVDRVDFHEPVRVGDVLHLKARINYVGRTSMEVEIEVFAEEIATGSFRHTNTCHLTMVSLKDGKPTPVPRLICRTREDKARYIQAKMRRELGIKYREDRNSFLSQFDSMTDSELDALLPVEARVSADVSR